MLRALAKQLASHGRRVFEGLVQRGEQGVRANPRNKDVARFGPEQRTELAPVRNFTRVNAFSQAGRSTWVHRLTGGKSLAQDMRLKVGAMSRGGAAQLQGRSQELVAGRRLISLYALVGLTMKAGNQQIELEDQQFDHICDEIKSLMNPAVKCEDTEAVSQDLQLSSFQFGSMIAKGCHSAVYSARLFEEETEMSDSDESFEVIEEESGDFEIVTEIEHEWQTRRDITIWDHEMDEIEENNDVATMSPQESAAMNLAVKMMFNYDTDSNSDSILRAMENETVPAKISVIDGGTTQQNGLKRRQLDPHPNIVDIRGVFVDEVPHLKDALSLYPAALPQRLNPEGFGHNKTMFLVMKRYDMTLQEYLEKHTPSLNEALFLLAQLLESMVHLNKQQIVHRDLKGNNILINESNLDLVVSDFGCCLADEQYGMKIPYPNRYMDKGGNDALRAPEIACAEPGRGCYLDYSRSDLWTVGTLAYEIFGCGNPFYGSISGQRLNSRTYDMEDLPEFPEYVPCAIRRLITSMLNRDPSKRPSPEEAANVIQLYLWAPEEWLVPENEPSKLDICRWLLLETAGVMCHRSWVVQTNPLLSLKQCFLARISKTGLQQAFSAIFR